MTPEQFYKDHPEHFFLSLDNKRSLEDYLHRLGVLSSGERVASLAVAGEGNMNRTIRMEIAGGSSGDRCLIVKQSYPWVERYPEIPAPWDRVLGEARFYLLTSASTEVASRMPRLVEVDPEARILILEDLGKGGDYTSLYQGRQLTQSEVETIVGWLSDLHATTFSKHARKSLADRGMRELNHEHLFVFPLQKDNGLDLNALTPGLADDATRLASDKAYVSRVTALGEKYLQEASSNDVLLHGDFFPGSWLCTTEGPMVIDPEFAFFGPPEFDVGVLLGHLYLAGQEESVHAKVLDSYRASADFDWHLAIGFLAVEIMRRLIGVAQLPLTIDGQEKSRLLSLSRELIVSSNPLQTQGLAGAASIQNQIESCHRHRAG